MLRSTRRRFLHTLAAAPATAGAPPEAGWAQLPSILERIEPPRFPAREFDVTRYGARPDGAADCTTAFARAIAACAQAGGGRVLVPAGRFLTGAIHLKAT